MPCGSVLADCAPCAPQCPVPHSALITGQSNIRFLNTVLMQSLPDTLLGMSLHRCLLKRPPAEHGGRGAAAATDAGADPVSRTAVAVRLQRTHTHTHECAPMAAQPPCTTLAPPHLSCQHQTKLGRAAQCLHAALLQERWEERAGWPAAGAILGVSSCNEHSRSRGQGLWSLLHTLQLSHLARVPLRRPQQAPGRDCCSGCAHMGG